MQRLTLADDLEPFVAALKAGQVVALPTDTVYGLACAAHLPEACAHLMHLKGRDPGKPSAVLAASLDTVFSTVLPELLGRSGVRARRLLPGPVTIVVPNPGQRFRWLCGGDPSRIGLRVPLLDPRLAAAIDRIPALLATSLNTAGEPPAVTLDVGDELAASIAVGIDAGPVAGGRPSTVVDVTGPEPVVLREGPLDADELRRRLAPV